MPSWHRCMPEQYSRPSSIPLTLLRDSHTGSPCMPTPLNELTASEIVVALNSGATTCEAVLRACLERIEAREPEVGAWQSLRATAAIEEARALDRNGRHGALLGVPFGVKDIIDTCDTPS